MVASFINNVCVSVFSQAKLRVDSMSMSTAQYRKPLNHKGQIIFGFGLRRYSGK